MGDGCLDDGSHQNNSRIYVRWDDESERLGDGNGTGTDIADKEVTSTSPSNPFDS